jgi:hypothetical protein
MVRLVILWSVVVVVFDAITSSLSKTMNVSYNWFILPQLLMYVVMGWVLVRRLKLNRSQALTVILIAGVVEATLGEWVSLLIRRPVEPPLPLLRAVNATIIAVAIQTFFGWLGMLVAKVRRGSTLVAP